MAIQLDKVIKPFSEMDDNERLALVKEIHHIKYVLKPDVKARKTRTAKKAATKKATSAKKMASSLMQNLTLEQKLELMKELEGGT